MTPPRKTPGQVARQKFEENFPLCGLDRAAAWEEVAQAVLADGDRRIVELANQADKYDMLHRKAIAKTEEVRLKLTAANQRTAELEKQRDEENQRIAHLEAELHDLRDSAVRSTKIIEGYRQFHVDQNQKLHRLRERIAELEAELRTPRPG